MKKRWVRGILAALAIGALASAVVVVRHEWLVRSYLKDLELEHSEPRFRQAAVWLGLLGYVESVEALLTLQNQDSFVSYIDDGSGDGQSDSDGDWVLPLLRGMKGKIDRREYLDGFFARYVTRQHQFIDQMCRLLTRSGFRSDATFEFLMRASRPFRGPSSPTLSDIPDRTGVRRGFLVFGDVVYPSIDAAHGLAEFADRSLPRLLEILSEDLDLGVINFFPFDEWYEAACLGIVKMPYSDAWADAVSSRLLDPKARENRMDYISCLERFPDRGVVLLKKLLVLESARLGGELLESEDLKVSDRSEPMLLIDGALVALAHAGPEHFETVLEWTKHSNADVARLAVGALAIFGSMAAEQLEELTKDERPAVAAAAVAALEARRMGR